GINLRVARHAGAKTLTPATPARNSGNVNIVETARGRLAALCTKALTRNAFSGIPHGATQPGSHPGRTRYCLPDRRPLRSPARPSPPPALECVLRHRN